MDTSPSCISVQRIGWVGNPETAAQPNGEPSVIMRDKHQTPCPHSHRPQTTVMSLAPFTKAECQIQVNILELFYA